MASNTLKPLGAALLLAALAWPVPSPAETVPAPATAPAPIPRTAEGKPDFSGIWQVLGEAEYDLEPHTGRRDAPPGPGVVVSGTIPYRPEALAQRQRNFEVRGKDDPRLKCFVLGVPRGIYYQAPFQIFQRPADLTLVHQFGNQVRTIRTDGSLHPEEQHQELWLGDSRGRWDGDTLVVDVTDFNEETWLDRAGNYHSEELHVIERWTLIDANTIDYRATLDDPKVYTKPWTINVLLHRRRDKGFQLIEDYCYTLDYAPFYPHKEGK
ncbi:hypothetical protein [Novosphingobium sp.]|uniref:hypothetical protein n=1 Tax=Novosphingobium sp. TaxID=1874826 RepID=UPI00260F1B4A|nr:hypothetical protein [Novosphingobium sp.]